MAKQKAAEKDSQGTEKATALTLAQWSDAAKAKAKGVLSELESAADQAQSLQAPEGQAAALQRAAEQAQALAAELAKAAADAAEVAAQAQDEAAAPGSDQG